MWWLLAWNWWNNALQNAAVSTEAKSSSPAQNDAASPSNAHPLQAFYQALATHGDHAFGVWDKGTGFSLFSANWERVTGLPTSLCAGHDFMQQLQTRDADMMASALQSLPTRLDSPLILEGRAKDPKASDGERALSFAMWPMSQDGVFTSIMVMVKDVDTLRRLCQSTHQIQAEKALAEKSRAVFLSNMSHELRTPLNAIMGFAEMMDNKTFGDVGHPTYEEYVKDIHFSGRHLLGKINDLLDIASIDQNQITLEEEDVSVQSLIADIVEAFSHTAFERNIKITCDIPKESIIAMMDRRKILCILTHFMSNALRHTASGLEITLSCRVHRTQGLVIAVRDQGEGITSARLSNIVRALQDGQTYFSMDSEGIGLGLSLSKELAVRHDGIISIDSIRHKGTVVSLVLPPERVVKGLGNGSNRRNIHLAKH